MEVHHHPNVEKKGFKEYLLEGLMIFLAVFMGFVAENIREHISDNSKEHTYLKSLRNDLRKDSAQLTELMQFGTKLAAGQDSLADLLKQIKSSTEWNDHVYQLFFKYAAVIPVFNSTETTLNQLINSGNFRLIERQGLADSISNYYDRVKSISVQGNANTTAALDCVQFAQNIFRLEYGLHPNEQNKTLISYDGAAIEKYRNKLLQMRISQQYYIKVELTMLYKSCLNILKMMKNDE